MGRGDEWHITLASKGAKASLMGAGRLVVARRRCLVREDERWRGRPGSWAYPVVRVHWNDPSLPLGVVPALLKQHGEIVTDVFEESVSRKFPGVLTGVRKLVFRVKDRTRFNAEVPHLLRPVFDGVRYCLLVVVLGRRPMCLC